MLNLVYPIAWRVSQLVPILALAVVVTFALVGAASATPPDPCDFAW